MDIAYYGNEYIKAGINVVPTGANKQPLVPWREWQAKLATPYHIEMWSMMKDIAGFQAVTGAISGNLTAIDFDDRELMRKWVNLIGGRDKLKHVLIQQTRRGFHVIFRSTEIGRNRRLAAINKKSGIETRAEGGLISVVPTPGYSFIGKWADINDLIIIDKHIYDTWIGAAISLDDKSLGRSYDERHEKALVDGAEGVIIQKYCEMYPISSWLEEYGYTETSNGWVRPGGQHPTVYVLTKELENGSKREFSFHHNSSDEMSGRPRDSFDWLREKVASGDWHDAMKMAGVSVGLDYTVERPLAVIPQSVSIDDIRIVSEVQGRSIILTDDSVTAEKIKDHMPVAIGPHKVWPRSVLSMLVERGFCSPENRFVAFSKRHDGVGERVAQEIDAKVSDVNLGEFWKNNGDAIQFANLMRFARSPRRGR